MGDGVGEGSFKSRFFTRRSISIPNPYTPTAPAMTKRSAGSHAPKRSRNPITRAGSVIPEIASPVPKRPHQLPGGTTSNRLREIWKRATGSLQNDSVTFNKCERFFLVHDVFRLSPRPA